MKRYALVLLALAAIVALAGCNQPKSGGIAVVNTARVYQESEAGKAGVKHLETLHEEMQNQLNQMQESLQQDQSDDNKRKFQEAFADYQKRMGAEQQQVISVLNENLQKVLDTYREKNGLDVIVGNDNVLSAGPSADVTGNIVAELNKLNITFKRMEAEAPAAPAEAPKQ
ncbi:OmpH family outer membrane protein [Nitratidesulfovibrio sp. D1]|uniref:OmpH family outer membrane protein n=1 Tax=Nitratidesulfovibrio sp. D1 TaxID=3440151 RepID=UPI003EBB87CD